MFWTCLYIWSIAWPKCPYNRIMLQPFSLLDNSNMGIFLVLLAILESLECVWKWWSGSYRFVSALEFKVLLFAYLDSILKQVIFFPFQIGVLEANFVEPAHDKQGFERTIVLSRLETRLVQMQKMYWYALRLCSSSVCFVQVFAFSYPKLLISHAGFGFNMFWFKLLAWFMSRYIWIFQFDLNQMFWCSIPCKC